MKRLSSKQGATLAAMTLLRLLPFITILEPADIAGIVREELPGEANEDARADFAQLHQTLLQTCSDPRLN